MKRIMIAFLLTVFFAGTAHAGYMLTWSLQYFSKADGGTGETTAVDFTGAYSFYLPSETELTAGPRLVQDTGSVRRNVISYKPLNLPFNSELFNGVAPDTLDTSKSGLTLLSYDDYSGTSSVVPFASVSFTRRDSGEDAESGVGYARGIEFYTNYFESYFEEIDYFDMMGLLTVGDVFMGTEYEYAMDENGVAMEGGLRYYFTATLTGMDSTTPIPEPSTFLLIGTGLLGLIVMRRKIVG